MRIALAIAVVAVAVAGCAQTMRQFEPLECRAGRPASAEAFDSSKVGRLVGSYRLFTVTTASGYDNTAVSGTLRLAVNDTLARYYVRTLRGYQRRGDRPLAGSYITGNSRPDTAIVEGAGVSIGCPGWMCTDASPDFYHIEWITTDRLGGIWENPQTGIGHAVGKNGEALPNPSGRFCAVRIGS